MMGHMEKAGCPVDPKEFFVVRHCAENVGGGFDAEASKQGGIVLCQNHIRDYEHAGESPHHSTPPLSHCGQHAVRVGYGDTR